MANALKYVSLYDKLVPDMFKKMYFVLRFYFALIFKNIFRFYKI